MRGETPNSDSKADNPLLTRRSGRIAQWLGLFVCGLVVLSLVALTLPTTWIFERGMTPELSRHAAALGETIGADVARAVRAGVPLDRLNDLQGLVGLTVGEYDQVRRVTLTDATGRVLYDARFHEHMGGDSARIATEAVAVELGGKVIATVSIGVAADYLSAALADIGYDVFTILLASSLITFEVVLALMATRLDQPIRQLTELIRVQAAGTFRVLGQGGRVKEIERSLEALNAPVLSLNARYAALLARAEKLGSAVPGEIQARLAALSPSLAPMGQPEAAKPGNAGDLRLPLFLFFLATEISRAFLPIFATELYQPLFGLERSFIVAMPMTAYVFASLLSTPLAGMIVARLGPKRAFLLGMVPTIASLVGEGFATGIPMLAGFRVIEGVGFSLVSIAAFDYIRKTSSGSLLATGAIIYGAAFVTAGICGTSIGGILADRAGFTGALIIAAILAAIATQLAISGLVDKGADVGAPAQVRWTPEWAALGSRRFVATSLFLAWPAQMAVTGLVYYATPLMMHEQGVSTSTIGRIVMAYFLTNLAASRLVASWADANGRHRAFALVGLAFSGAGALLPMVGEGPVWLVMAVVVAGLAQAIGGPSRGAIMIEECSHIKTVSYASALSLYRIIERCGALAGPLFVAAIVPFWGYKQAIVFLGLTVVAAAVAYAVLARLDRRPDQDLASGELT